jgi:hypothetical protein
MLNWLKSLFGEGMVRLEIETAEGKIGVLKSKYVGCADTEIELLTEIVNGVFVEKGIKLKRARIVGIHGTGIVFTPSGNWWSVNKV